MRKLKEMITISGVNYKLIPYIFPNKRPHYISKAGEVIYTKSFGRIETVQSYYHWSKGSYIPTKYPRFMGYEEVNYNVARLVYESWVRELNDDEVISFIDNNVQNHHLDNLFVV